MPTTNTANWNRIANAVLKGLSPGFPIGKENLVEPDGPPISADLAPRTKRTGGVDVGFCVPERCRGNARRVRAFVTTAVIPTLQSAYTGSFDCAGILNKTSRDEDDQTQNRAKDVMVVLSGKD
jgi:hypothetical protein